MFKRAWEYVVTVWRAYRTHVSGWLLALVAIGLTIAAAAVRNDPARSARIVVWAAWLTSGAAIYLVFVAQYDAWREERAKKESAEQKLQEAIEPKLAIIHESHKTPYHHDVASGGGHNARRVRVGVKNLSRRTIDGVGCKMLRIEPEIHGECFPLPLVPMHFHTGPLAPGDIRWVDVAMNVAINNEGHDISITHSVDGLKIEFPKDKPYRVSLLAFGQDCSCERTFSLALDDVGLVCLHDPALMEGH